MRNMPDFYDCVRVCVWAINFTIPTFVWCNNFCLNCKTFLAQKTINWVGIKNVFRSWKLVGADVAASNCNCSISIHFHYKYQQSKSEKGKADPRQSIQCRNSDTLSSPLLKILLLNNWISMRTQFENIFSYFETKVSFNKNIFVVLIEENRQLPSLGRIISLHYIQIIYVYIIYHI